MMLFLIFSVVISLLTHALGSLIFAVGGMLYFVSEGAPLSDGISFGLTFYLHLGHFCLVPASAPQIGLFLSEEDFPLGSVRAFIILVLNTIFLYTPFLGVCWLIENNDQSKLSLLRYALKEGVTVLQTESASTFVGWSMIVYFLVALTAFVLKRFGVV